jgi:hypothetical protein
MQEKPTWETGQTLDDNTNMDVTEPAPEDVDIVNLAENTFR